MTKLNELKQELEKLIEEEREIKTEIEKLREEYNLDSFGIVEAEGNDKTSIS